MKIDKLMILLLLIIGLISCKNETENTTVNTTPSAIVDTTLNRICV